MASVTLNPTADTYLDQGNPTTAQGTIDPTEMFIGWDGANAYRGLLRFDLSSIPSNATVSAAVLTLFENGAGSQIDASATFHANQMTRLTWVDTSATWNKYDGTNNWTAAGGDFTATGRSAATLGSVGDLVFNDAALVALVQAKVAGTLDLEIKESTETGGSLLFLTVDSVNGGSKPTLAITYTVPVTGPSQRSKIIALAMSEEVSLWQEQ